MTEDEMLALRIHLYDALASTLNALNELGQCLKVDDGEISGREGCVRETGDRHNWTAIVRD